MFDNVVFMSTKFFKKSSKIDPDDSLTKEKVIYTTDCLKRPELINDVIQNFEKHYLMELRLKDKKFINNIDVTQITSLTALSVFQPLGTVNLKIPSGVERLEIYAHEYKSFKANLENVKHLEIVGNLEEKMPENIEFLKTGKIRDWSCCTKLKEIVLTNFESENRGNIPNEMVQLNLPICTSKLVVEKTNGYNFDLSESCVELLEVINSRIDTIVAPKSMKKIMSDFKIGEIVNYLGEYILLKDVIEPKVDDEITDEAKKCVLQ
ncbi:hypothetical protein EIN_327200 [Entamoeba invadens IP1]|uniref:Leucine-rich repeat containing protein n=1 Tax=Entamoeba invadens IP1 TaxID=370355 RepID=A0A0A1U0I6_ENTIV|nr:hypothetical protein EIN_327200 [Entamoeba invadens IP1]ELP86073.1 hypothetical protein EIN_327200 [Entamoeba invadens IP1]|eukprot:XP_004185419.1 hypothetical protein EIN_327200 [Entamoeba invadens IP1]